MTQPQEKQNYIAAFMVLLLLIAASVGVGFLARNALFTLLQRYSEHVGTFTHFRHDFEVLALSH